MKLQARFTLCVAGVLAAAALVSVGVWGVRGTRELLWIVAMAAVLLAVVHACVVWFVVRPVRHLARQIARIAEGGSYAAVLADEGRADALGLNVPAFHDLLVAVRRSSAELRDIRENLERRVAERTAEISEKHAELAAMRENALDAIVSMDQHGLITGFNPAAERMFGHAAQAVVCKPLALMLIPKEHRDAYQQGMAQHLRAGAGAGATTALDRRVEMDMLRADGTPFPVEMALTAVRVRVGSEDGTVSPAATTFTAFIRDITERRRADDEARKAAKLALVASRTDNAVVITDTHGHIEWVNEGFERITGYAPEEVLGRKPGSILQGPETDPETVAMMRDHLARGEGFRTEVVNYAKDGHKYWLAIGVQPIYDGAGRLTNFIAIESDITERKCTEQALRESEERLSAIVDNASAVVYMKDLFGRYLMVNRRFADLTGRPREVLVGRTDHELWPAATADALVANDRAVLDACRPIEFEETLTHGDGPHTYIATKFPLRNADGEVYALCGILTDITERKRAEEAVRRAEEKYRGIFENAVHGIFQTTLDGRYVSVNHALAEIYGYASSEELVAAVNEIGREVYVDPARRRQFVEAVCRDGAVTDFVSQVRRKDGQVRWISEKARAVYADGQVLYFEGTVEDITPRREAEAALLQAKEVAEAANRSKSEFLANMSHEIRTPLNGVIGMASLLLGTELNATQRRYAQIAKSSADALLMVINQILDFSKVEAGRVELEQVDFDLRTAVEEVAEMLAHKASAKGVELAYRIDPDLRTWLCGDPQRLRQVLINLVNNAIKFTERGEVVIRALPDKANPGAIRFEVSDTGAGIPAERMDRLFKPFSQVDASTTRKHGGTGLGLVICKQLVELMGGQIGVRSEAGRGSVFWFTVVMPDGPERRVRQLSAGSALRGARVLVVDDNATQRTILSEQLANWGISAECAADAHAAMAALSRAAAEDRPFRVALLDMLMPGGNAPDLARAICSRPDLASTRLVLVAAIDSPVDSQRVREGGFVEIVNKPLRQSQLFDALMKAVASASPPQADRSAEAVASSPASEPAAGTGPGGSPARGDAPRVLLAEDNDVNQLVASELLTRSGYRCDIVGDGAKAVAAVARGGYALVLMDCQMPEMDGFDATRAIRSREQANGLPRLPIVALTANAVKGDRERCLAAGMDAYLSKPLDPKLLITTIKQVLSRQPGGMEPATAPAAPPTATATTTTVDATAAPADPSAPFDTESLLQRCLGDREFMSSILGKFREQAAANVERLASSVGAADVAETRRLAHGLKGAAANLSAEALRVRAAELEERAAAGVMDDAERLLGEIRAELDRCVAYIPKVSSAT